MTRVTLAIISVLLCGWPLSAQWTNRSQHIGQGHHVYIEGYDFPTYSVGPTYPAVSPDGRTLAFSARDWLSQLRDLLNVRNIALADDHQRRRPDLSEALDRGWIGNTFANRRSDRVSVQSE